MKPKEKAKELVRNMFQPKIGSLEYNQGQTHIFNQYSAAKPCALVAVDEIIDNCKLENIGYWQEVKEEIEKNY
jgi:hypothetical protein